MLHYDYSESKKACAQFGLVWLGDDYRPLLEADAAAALFGMTQAQVDVGMRHHLWQVKVLFTPTNYPWLSRLAIAFYFLTGWKPKNVA